MLEAWQRLFQQAPVEVVDGEWSAQDADALVLPVLSNGSVDRPQRAAAEAALTQQTLRAIDQVVFDAHHGEMTTANVERVPAPEERWPVLIAACTRHVRQTCVAADDSGRVFEAALRAAAKHNAQGADTRIESLLCPALAAETGAYLRVAAGMFVAYETLYGA